MLTSVGPPAGNGTTMRTGRLGKLARRCPARMRAARLNATARHSEERQRAHQRAHRYFSFRVTSSNSSSTVTFLVIICCFSE